MIKFSKTKFWIHWIFGHLPRSLKRCFKSWKDISSIWTLSLLKGSSYNFFFILNISSVNGTPKSLHHFWRLSRPSRDDTSTWTCRFSSSLIPVTWYSCCVLFLKACWIPSNTFRHRLFFVYSMYGTNAGFNMSLIFMLYSLCSSQASTCSLAADTVKGTNIGIIKYIQLCLKSIILCAQQEISISQNTFYDFHIIFLCKNCDNRMSKPVSPLNFKANKCMEQGITFPIVSFFKVLITQCYRWERLICVVFRRISPWSWISTSKCQNLQWLPTISNVCI